MFYLWDIDVQLCVHVCSYKTVLAVSYSKSLKLVILGHFHPVACSLFHCPFLGHLGLLPCLHKLIHHKVRRACRDMKPEEGEKSSFLPLLNSTELRGDGSSSEGGPCSL